MFDIFLGVDNTSEGNTNAVARVRHIDTKTLFKMSDEERKELYDSIVASVLNNEHRTEKTIQ